MHISQLHRQKANPRNLTPTDGYSVDLGVVTLRDAAINGRTIPLIPYANGRLISGIRFVMQDGAVTISGQTLFFATPNTGQNNGMAVVGDSGAFDIAGSVQSGNNQSLIVNDNSTSTVILDAGPLLAATELTFSDAYVSVGIWEANTAYCKDDAILDDNGHVQYITTNGVSGSELPTFSTSGGTTSDGTATWTDQGEIPDVAVHVIADVIEGVSPMPPFVASMEFIDQPVDVVAGATMDDITVIFKDQNGDPYSLFQQSSQIAIFGAGTLVGTVLQQNDPVTGIATFSGLSITEPGTGYVLRVRQCYVNIPDIFSDPFDVTAP